MTEQKFSTSHQIPAGVKLTPERHQELVTQLAAGRAPEATAEEARAGLLAGNALLTAYWSLIVANARSKAPSQAAADDRAGAAGERAVHAIRSYDPARGATLLGWFASCRVWGGEAGLEASLPIVSTTRAARRVAWSDGDGIASMLSLDVEDGVGEMVGDSAGWEAQVERELDVRSAMLALDGRDREWLAAAYGLSGGRSVPTEDLAAAAGVSVHTVRRSLAHSRGLLSKSPQLARI
ncbi:hypothetical protein [Frigoribacterium sp. UYMn621]|uniref:hypothetical protein n=1 Tax=Frigoribacterium sp. UYMn621 TaxID=3156343 RepID=UPI003395A31A